MAKALQISKLKFSYGATPVLDISSFEMSENEIVFLYGPSGSGKSTLLELIAGVLQVQDGELKVLESSFNKKSASQLDHFRAEHIGTYFKVLI